MITISPDGLLLSPDIHDFEISNISWINQSLMITATSPEYRPSELVNIFAVGVIALRFGGVIAQKVISDMYIFEPPHERYLQSRELADARNSLGPLGYDERKTVVYCQSSTEADLMFCAERVVGIVNNKSE